MTTILRKDVVTKSSVCYVDPFIPNNSGGDTFAVVASLIDLKDAFPRQCPKLGIQSFIENGVCPSLIPLLKNYFQDREMSVK